MNNNEVTITDPEDPYTNENTLAQYLLDVIQSPDIQFTYESEDNRNLVSGNSFEAGDFIVTVTRK